MAKWTDASFTRAWLQEDDLGDLLARPRSLAAAVVALELPAPRTVVDLGSGPGTFLGVFLDRFPQAQGVWSDVSEPMREEAATNLARFGDRVTYRLGDLTDLEGAGIPRGVDVILTSRALHHLDSGRLTAFYREAASRLAPGGWLVNLDHVGVSEGWQRRLREVRPLLTGRRRERRRTPHRHDRPLPGVRDHLRGFAEAGLDDVEVAWRELRTCLFLGRRAAG
ncbi:MAG: class I SAM-dependent methyltransferase [Candidatus Dormibacteraeota bacterium]|nr:class I SAM-dependent methyltransferase [Candidatus Dormibacteraeota bacterium]